MRQCVGLKILLICVMFLGTFIFAACDDNRTEAQKRAQEKAQNGEVYQPKNDMERKIYNKRQQIADDPTTILWCTSAFPIPSSPIFTVPIVGKLASGNKRPYPTSIALAGGSGGSYFPEIPGPDGMFGSSGEYRYGFTPGDYYADWYNMPCFCTTEPTIWQRQETKIVMQSDPQLLEAQNAARDALRKGNPKIANEILENAVKNLGGKR